MQLATEAITELWGMSPPWLKGNPAYLALCNVAWLLDCTLWHAQEILWLTKSY